MDLRQSPQYAKFMKLIGWEIEKANESYIYIRKIPLTPFSVIKVQRPKKIPFKKINQLAKKYHAFQVTIEPNNDISIFRAKRETRFSNESRRFLYDRRNLRAHGFRPSRSPFLPTKTIQLDLSQSEEKILAQMKKDARYGIRKAKGIEIPASRDSFGIKQLRNEEIERFHQAWKKSVSWNRWVPSLKSLEMLKKAFGQNAIFLTATCNLKPKTCLAGAVILMASKTAYYYYAFTSRQRRQKFAQYLLVWEAIKLAKKQGCKIFDFEGIYDERFPIKSWKGFSHFKKSFGGKEIKSPGCFVKYRFPF